MEDNIVTLMAAEVSRAVQTAVALAPVARAHTVALQAEEVLTAWALLQEILKEWEAEEKPKCP